MIYILCTTVFLSIKLILSVLFRVVMKKELNNSIPIKHLAQCAACPLVNVCPCPRGNLCFVSAFSPLCFCNIFSCIFLSAFYPFQLEEHSPWQGDIVYETYSSVSSLSSVNIIFSALGNELLPPLVFFLRRQINSPSPTPRALFILSTFYVLVYLTNMN